MYEDEPQDRVHDVLAEAVFGEHPLGRRVLGEAEVIASIPVPDIEAYHRRPLHRRRTSSSAPPATSTTSGSSSWPSGSSRRRRRQRRAAPAPTLDGAGAAALLREGHRAVPHLLRRARASPATTSAATRSPCSTRSSAARPPRGSSARCARSAASPTRSAPTTSSTPTPGLVATYVGTREDNVEEACAIIGAELARLRSEPVSAEELARAKESVKGRLVLSSESTAARMTRISRATLFDLPIESLDEMLAKVDAVEVDDLTELAAELYGAERLSAACVGADEDCFREALAPVSESAGRGMIRVARLRRRRADGAGGLRGGRGRRGHGAGRQGRPGARRRAGRRARRRRRRRRLHDPRHRARQRRAPASRPASTPSSAPPASTSTRCATAAEGAARPTASSPPTSRSARCC